MRRNKIPLFEKKMKIKWRIRIPIFKCPYTTTHSHYVIYIYRYASEGQQLILQFCSKQHKGDPRESPVSSNFWLTCWHHGHKSSSHTVYETSDFHLLKPFCCVVRILILLPTAHTGMLGQFSPYFFLLMLLWFHRYTKGCQSSFVTIW